MLTEAVGIVDKAANDEEFLVVKRANMGDTAAAEKTTKANGEATAAGADAGAVAAAGQPQQDTVMHATMCAARDRLWQAGDLISKDPAKATEEIRAVADMLASVSAMVPTAAAKALVDPNE
jgi:hypothetical protein